MAIEILALKELLTPDDHQGAKDITLTKNLKLIGSTEN